MQRSHHTILDVLQLQAGWKPVLFTPTATLSSEVAELTQAKLTCLTTHVLIHPQDENPQYLFTKQRNKWQRSSAPQYQLHFPDGKTRRTSPPFIELTALLHHHGLKIICTDSEFLYHNQDPPKLAISITGKSAFRHREILQRLTAAGANIGLLYFGSEWIDEPTEDYSLDNVLTWQLPAQINKHYFGNIIPYLAFDQAQIPALHQVLLQTPREFSALPVPPISVDRGCIYIADLDTLHTVICELMQRYRNEELRVLLKIFTIKQDQAEFIDEFLQINFNAPPLCIRLNLNLVNLCLALPALFGQLQPLKTLPATSITYSNPEFSALIELGFCISHIAKQLNFYQIEEFLLVLFPDEKGLIRLATNYHQPENQLPPLATNINACFYQGNQHNKHQDCKLPTTPTLSPTKGA